MFIRVLFTWLPEAELRWRKETDPNYINTAIFLPRLSQVWNLEIRKVFI